MIFGTFHLNFKMSTLLPLLVLCIDKKNGKLKYREKIELCAEGSYNDDP